MPDWKDVETLKKLIIAMEASAKPDWKAVAAHMGNGCTPGAVEKFVKRAKDADKNASANPVVPAPAKPTKAAKPATTTKRRRGKAAAVSNGTTDCDDLPPVKKTKKSQPLPDPEVEIEVKTEQPGSDKEENGDQDEQDEQDEQDDEEKE